MNSGQNKLKQYDVRHYSEDCEPSEVLDALPPEHAAHHGLRKIRSVWPS